MHLKQFRWKTVPSARTNAPCIGFPHDEQVLYTERYEKRVDFERCMVKEGNLAYADAKLVEVTDANGLGGEPDLLDESEVSLRRRPEASELPC
jgi:hypothetical protein